jgi:hypothetical protein
MSKMTLVDEVVRKEEYDRLKYVEFLEFLGRVAHAKYLEDTDTPLSVKIERVLDDIFAVYGLKRKRDGGNAGDEETSEESCFVEDESVQ